MGVGRGAPDRVRALLVDLNNFARYPTIAIGYLVAILRRAGIDVDVFSPLSIGLPGVEREPPVRAWGRVDQFARHVTANAESRIIRAARALLVERRHPIGTRGRARFGRELERRLRRGYDVVLASTYLMYGAVVGDLAARCASDGIPLLVGGPYFSQPEVLEAWRRIPGVTSVFGGEGEAHVLSLVAEAVGARGLPDGRGAPAAVPPHRAAVPLRDLDQLPFPDYSDFPWERYPNRIVPLITGRGCGWGACRFCSDVTSSAGRTFRTRSVESVLREVAHQRASCSADLFAFCDLKLNSHLPMWHGLIEGIQSRAPGCQWIGSVHVDDRAANGLERESLKAAAAAGMVRLTTGLESGSQRVLDSMSKGTSLERVEDALHGAAEAGISARVTMIVGYPGEDAEDVERSAVFLERNRDVIDRVLLNRFALVVGTRIQRRMRAGIEAQDTLRDLQLDAASATVRHRYAPASSRAYRRALWRLLGATHAINKRPLALPATAFEGVM